MKRMTGMGAVHSRLKVKLAGGARMFSGSESNILKVGGRNVQACAEELALLRIPVPASDTAGTHGRTIGLLPDSGGLKIRSVGAGEKFI